jgi:hypothetical protein
MKKAEKEATEHYYDETEQCKGCKFVSQTNLNGLLHCDAHQKKIALFTAALREKAAAGCDGAAGAGGGAQPPAAPAVAVEPTRCEKCGVNPTADSKYCDDFADKEIFKICAFCDKPKVFDNFVSCTECRDVFKAGVQACKGCQHAMQALPKRTTCGWHEQMYCSALAKARAQADADAKGTPAAADEVSAKGAPAAADDGSAKCAPAAPTGAVELPASSGSAKGVRRWPCALCETRQPKEDSKYCAHCHVVVSVRDSYFDETNSCMRCKVAKFNVTGNYCGTHLAEIDNEVDKQMAKQ